MSITQNIAVATGINTCLTKSVIINKYNGSVIENQDGTVSVFVNTGSGIAPLILSKICCQYLDPSYVFDIQKQKCLWSPSIDCSVQQVFKIVLNPKGNDGTLFYVEPNDNCSLTIDFDYLFKIKCETLDNILTTSNNPNTGVILNNNVNSESGRLSNICESLTIQIAEYTAMLNNMSYSIICEALSVNPLETISVKVKSFGKSAFGSSAPFGFGETLVTNQLYCINEPNGLSQWRTILGDLRFNLFINGDQTSYTCDDVQTIFDLNSVIENSNIINGTNNPLLIIPCDTPVNTKSDLLKIINDLMNQLNDCNSLSTSARGINGGINVSGSTIPINTKCVTPLDFFESFDTSISLDVITSANTLNSVYSGSLLTSIGSGNLYNYFVSHPNNSGFYVCGDPTGNETQPNCTPLILNLTGGSTNNVYTCNNVVDSLINDLYTEYSITGTSLSDFQNSLPVNSFASQWLHYHAIITDPNIISQILNQKITLSININHVCGDFCVLVDEISLDKVCSHVDSNNLLLTQSPGFGLNKIVDNKKSWLANVSPTNRPFVISNNKNGNSIRQTNYDVNDERLVINTKEIDLDISLASAIETDVWCYISDNPCLLTGVTSCFPCLNECGSKNFQDDECFSFMDGYFYDFMDGLTTGSSISPFNFSNCCGDNMIDFTSLMTQPLSAVTTIEAFEYFLTSELIDVKNRQTLSSYPTLRALYDRYMNSGLYCDNNSSMFTYLTMKQFASLIGNYWVDIVEQVIPATTIWGSTMIYSNTIFDQQKFKYKSYSSLFCGNPYSGQTVLSPINGISGECTGASVSMTSIYVGNSSNIRLRPPITNYCNSLCIAQMNVGSEFIGSVSIVGTNQPNFTNSNNVIIENG